MALLLNTVCLEILVERLFGELLRICHLADCTMEVGQALCHNDVHSQGGDFSDTEIETVCQSSLVCDPKWHQCQPSQHCIYVDYSDYLPSAEKTVLLRLVFKRLWRRDDLVRMSQW